MSAFHPVDNLLLEHLHDLRWANAQVQSARPSLTGVDVFWLAVGLIVLATASQAKTIAAGACLVILAGALIGLRTLVIRRRFTDQELKARLAEAMNRRGSCVATVLMLARAKGEVWDLSGSLLRKNKFVHELIRRLSKDDPTEGGENKEKPQGNNPTKDERTNELPPPALTWKILREQLEQEITPNMSGLTNDILRSILGWITNLSIKSHGWTLTTAVWLEPEPSNYGRFLLCRWERDWQIHWCAVGFLLGYGRGQANDLRRKLQSLESIPDDFDSAIIVFPRNVESASTGPKHLPPASLGVWNEASPEQNVAVRVIPRPAVLGWLTVGEILRRQYSHLGEPRLGMTDFLQDETDFLIPFLFPPLLLAECSPAVAS